MPRPCMLSTLLGYHDKRLPCVTVVRPTLEQAGIVVSLHCSQLRFKGLATDCDIFYVYSAEYIILQAVP